MVSTETIPEDVISTFSLAEPLSREVRYQVKSQTDGEGSEFRLQCSCLQGVLPYQTSGDK